MFEFERGLQTKGSRGEMTGIARSVKETTGFNEIAQLFEMQEEKRASLLAPFPLKPIR